MSADLTAIKAAMTAAGFSPSSGSDWTVDDSNQYLDYCNLHWPITVETALVGLAYPGVLPDGFPGKIPTPPHVLQSIAVTGTATAVAGGTQQLTATGTYATAPTTADLTASATWVSSDTAVATVSAGLVTAVAAGTTSITAAQDSITSPGFPFTVTATPQAEAPEVKPNTPPAAEALKPDGTIVAGTGIPATNANSASDNVMQTFLIPLIAHTQDAGPGTDGAYSVELQDGQDFGVAFGATLLKGNDGSIAMTDLYDVKLSIEVGGKTANFDLVSVPTQPQKYNWASVEQPSYIITDSATNATGTTSQNVTRLTFLKDAGLVDDVVGNVTVTMVATHKSNNAATTNQITVAVTQAAPAPTDPDTGA